MRIATTIFTFGGGREITQRHLPIWHAHTDELLLVFPYDDPCVLLDVELLAHEVSNKYGMPCLKRQFFGMKAALRYKADYYVFIEYDGFLLRRPEPRDAVQANVFHRKRKDDGYAASFCPIFRGCSQQRCWKDLLRKRISSHLSVGLWIDGWRRRWSGWEFHSMDSRILARGIPGTRFNTLRKRKRFYAAWEAGHMPSMA